MVQNDRGNPQIFGQPARRTGVPCRIQPSTIAPSEQRSSRCVARTGPLFAAFVLLNEMLKLRPEWSKTTVAIRRSLGNQLAEREFPAGFSRLRSRPPNSVAQGVLPAPVPCLLPLFYSMRCSNCALNGPKRPWQSADLWATSSPNGSSLPDSAVYDRALRTA